MKQFLGLVLGLGLFSVESATINFSEEIIPLQLNQTKVSHSLFNQVDSLEAAKGHHRVKVKYSDLYETDYDDHETIESEPFWLDLHVTDEQQTLHVYIERPETYEDAKLFIQNPYALVKSKDQITKKVAIAAPQVAIKPVARMKEAGVDAPVSKLPDALYMMEYWWQRATEAQRAQFLATKKGS